jgi:hypothetical protein
MVMVKLSWADHLRMEAKKQIKSTSINPKRVDFYDTDILEKAHDNSKTIAEIRKPENKHGDEDHTFDFHEQFFS